MRHATWCVVRPHLFSLYALSAIRKIWWCIIIGSRLISLGVMPEQRFFLTSIIVRYDKLTECITTLINGVFIIPLCRFYIYPYWHNSGKHHDWAHSIWTSLCYKQPVWTFSDNAANGRKRHDQHSLNWAYLANPGSDQGLCICLGLDKECAVHRER